MMRTMLAIGLLALPLLAQRNEISLQFGGTLTQRRVIALPAQISPVLGIGALTEDNGLGGGLVYRLRIVRLGQADIMAELPIFVVQATNQDILPAIVRPLFGSTSGVSGFVTPGGVLRLFPNALLSPYGFFGGGYARVLELQLTSIQPFRGAFVNDGTWALNYGGGLDLRVARWFALRGELRNFYTGAPDAFIGLPDETRQRNTLLATFGIVFKF